MVRRLQCLQRVNTTVEEACCKKATPSGRMTPVKLHFPLAKRNNGASKAQIASDVIIALATQVLFRPLYLTEHNR